MLELLVGFSKQSQPASVGVILHTDLCGSEALYLNLNDQLTALKCRNNAGGLLWSCWILLLVVAHTDACLSENHGITKSGQVFGHVIVPTQQ